MRIQFAIALAISACAQAQTAPNTRTEATFHFSTPQTPAGSSEMATILRTVIDLRDVSIENAPAGVRFSGTGDQLKTAEWVLGELDRPGGETSAHEYTSGAGEAVRVEFLTNVLSPQGTQEVLTVLRTVADTQKVFHLTSRRALVMRGKPDDIAFAAWIIAQLNQPVTDPLDPQPHIYGGKTAFGYAARVVYLTNVPTPQGFQELLTVLRTVADVQHIFNYSQRRALVFRDNARNIELVQWLIDELNRLPGEQNPGTQSWTRPGVDDVTRVFFVSASTPQSLQAALRTFRSEGRIAKAFVTTTPASIVVRGTADQIEAAARLIAGTSGLAMLQ